MRMSTKFHYTNRRHTDKPTIMTSFGYISFFVYRFCFYRMVLPNTSKTSSNEIIEMALSPHHAQFMKTYLHTHSHTRTRNLGKIVHG